MKSSRRVARLRLMGFALFAFAIASTLVGYLFLPSSQHEGIYAMSLLFVGMSAYLFIH